MLTWLGVLRSLRGTRLGRDRIIVRVRLRMILLWWCRLIRFGRCGVKLLMWLAVFVNRFMLLNRLFGGFWVLFVGFGWLGRVRLFVGRRFILVCSRGLGRMMVGVSLRLLLILLTGGRLIRNGLIGHVCVLRIALVILKILGR